MDLKLRQLQRRFHKDPKLLPDYWNQARKSGTVPVEFLMTAIRIIQADLHRQFFEEFYRPSAEYAGYIFRGPKDIEKYINDVHFHLSPCVCGAPTWQYPCPWCSFEQNWDFSNRYAQEQMEKCRNSMSEDRFCKKLNTVKRLRLENIEISPYQGNLALFWAHRNMDQAISSWKHQASVIGHRALEMINQLIWPNCHEVWKAFEKRKCLIEVCDRVQQTSLYASSAILELPFSAPIAYRTPYCRVHSKELGYPDDLLGGYK